MTTRRVNDPNASTSRRRPPAKTLEDRENQLIAHAVDLAEKQLLDGSASAQVITHYLRLGSTSEKLAQQYKEEEIKLLRIKAETLAATQRTEELMVEALDAFRAYSTGKVQGGDDDDD